MYKALLCFAAELVWIQCVGEVIVDVRRVESCNEVGESVPIRGLVEAPKRRIPVGIDIVGELRSGLLGQICDGCEMIFVSRFERVLDALVELLIAASRFDRPKVAAANDRSVLGVEVEREVYLVEGAQIKVLRGAGQLHHHTRRRVERGPCTHLHGVGMGS